MTTEKEKEKEEEGKELIAIIRQDEEKRLVRFKLFIKEWGWNMSDESTRQLLSIYDSWKEEEEEN